MEILENSAFVHKLLAGLETFIIQTVLEKIPKDKQYKHLNPVSMHLVHCY